MRKIGEITFNGKKVVVRELTVTQVADQIEGIDTQLEPTTLDWMFSSKYMPQATLEMILDTTLDSLVDADTAPSEVEVLYKEAARYNPFLIEALSRMREIADLMRGASRGLESAPSTWSTEATPEFGITDLASFSK